MCDESPRHTKEMIFGTDSESESELCEDSEASRSAVGSSKQPRSEGSHRARLTVAQKMEAMKHYQENPGMSYPQLIEWCFKKIEMTKKLSKAAVCFWFSEKKGKRSQKEKLEQAVQVEINPFKLAAKSFQGTHFPELEDELFAWVCRCESRKACLTDDIITEKALSIAARLGLATFKASDHWISRLKKRHDIRVRVLHGEAS
jgi:hypothetical protein